MFRPETRALASVAFLTFVLSACSSTPPKHEASQSFLSELENTVEQGTIADGEALAEVYLEALAKEGTETEELAESALDVAMAFFESDRVGAQEAAESWFQRVLEIRRQGFGSQHLSLSESLGDLSSFYFLTGRWKEAERLELENIDLLLALGEIESSDRRRVDLAIIRFSLGEYNLVHADLLELLPRIEALDDPETLILTLSIMSEAHRVRLELEAAETVAIRALGLARENFPPEDPFAASLLNNLAAIALDRGRLDLAERRFDQAEEAYRRVGPGFERDALNCAINRTEVGRLQGKTASATEDFSELLERARTQLDPSDPLVPRALDRLAAARLDSGRPDLARPLLEEAVGLLLASLGAHPQVADAQLELAKAAIAEGRFEIAVDAAERARQTRGEFFGEAHPDTASAALKRIEARRGLGADVAELETELQQALEILESSPLAPEATIRAWELLAAVQHDDGSTEQAKASLERALEGIDDLRLFRGGDEAVRAGFLVENLELYRRMIRWQLEAGEAEAAFAWSERSRARTLLDRLAANRLDLEATIPVDERAALAEQRSRWVGERARIEHELTTIDPGDEEAPARREHLEVELDRILGELEAVDQRMMAASPAWQRLASQSGAIDLAELQTLLGDSRRLLVYGLDAQRSHLLVIGPLGIELHWLEVDEAAGETLGIDSGPLSETALEAVLLGAQRSRGLLEELPVAYSSRDLERGTWRQASLNDRLAALSEVLLPNAARNDLLSSDLVAVVADGILHRLPLDILPLGDQSWLEIGPPTLSIPSATTLVQLQESARGLKPGQQRALLVAVPEPSDSSLPRLDGTLSEIEAAGRVLVEAGSQLRTLSAEAATEAALREALEDHPELIHLATHGVVEPGRSSLRSALITATGQGETAEDDGRLELLEIYRLELEAQLVFLSACSTGAGEILGPEGVFAMSRGMLGAGAKRVVATQWPVDDQSTIALSEAFYRRLIQGDPPAKALHEARRELAAEHTLAFWGPWFLTGAW